MNNKLIYGLDFGTTHSAIAVFNNDKVEVVPVDKSGGKIMRSVLFFPDKHNKHDERYKFYIGQEAIDLYIESEMEGRLLQSIKSLLPSKWFNATYIQNRTYNVADLICLIISNLKKKADKMTGVDVKTVILGRPAIFSEDGDKEKEELAVKRLLFAAKNSGFEEVYLQIEPIAAAFSYELLLSKPELVFVADLGGGTSDFTLMKLSPEKAKQSDRKSDILATSGIRIAGDDFDSDIMWGKLVKYFGYGSKFESSIDKWFDMPIYLMRTICKWYKISMLKTIRDRNIIHDIAIHSDNPEAIERLQTLIGENLGFALFQAIEKAKCGLSMKEEEKINFHQSIIDIDEIIKRIEFEAMISEKMNKISQCIDKLLLDSKVKISEIDSVFLTGGTSFVPYVKKLLAEKFGADKIKPGDAFLSVVNGLALSGYSLIR